MLNYYKNFVLFYTLNSLICFIFDVLSYKVNKFRKYKIDSIPFSEKISTYKKVMPNVLFNVFISSLPVTIFFDKYYEKHITNENYIYTKLILFKYLSQLIFYFCHRLLHTKLLYKYHKKHHEITVPIGISAIYSSVIEFYVGNTVPVILSVILLDIPSKYFDLIMVLVISNATIFSHSNIIVSNHHDIHHKLFKYNYGSKWCDRLFGTLKIHSPN